MQIKIRLEKDEDGMWVATCPSLPGCISQGKSQKAAAESIKSAVKLHLKYLAEDGVPIFQTKGVKETLVKVQI